jgi:hypothetical protein
MDGALVSEGESPALNNTEFEAYMGLSRPFVDTNSLGRQDLLPDPAQFRHSHHACPHTSRTRC